jgi:hypothetical protein
MASPALIGAILGRAEAQVMRLACLYALLDHSTVIHADHLLAALALWEYSEASARYIFGDALGDPIADELLRGLRSIFPKGLTRTEIRDFFGRNLSADDIGRALKVLLERKLARFEKKTDTKGRHPEVWFATDGSTTETTETTEDRSQENHRSFRSYLELGKAALASAGLPIAEERERFRV